MSADALAAEARDGRRLTADELRVVVDAHAAWLRGESAGRRLDLSGAILNGANLDDASLDGAILNGANLDGASLDDASLNGANLDGAILPHFQIPAGDLIGWKALCGGVLARLRIPAAAKRTASLVGYKCRAEYVEVLELIDESGGEAPVEGVSGHDCRTIYRVGEIVRPDRYCDDIRIECSHGIHFFATEAEAREWL